MDLFLVIVTIVFLTGVVLVGRSLGKGEDGQGETEPLAPQGEATSSAEETRRGEKEEREPISSDWTYPGATSVTRSETSLVLQSFSDPEAITGWYKEKIRRLGMKTKSFVATKTNGNVLNSLVGSDGEREIRVTITRRAGAKEVLIDVTTSS